MIEQIKLYFKDKYPLFARNVQSDNCFWCPLNNGYPAQKLVSYLYFGKHLLQSKQHEVCRYINAFVEWLKKFCWEKILSIFTVFRKGTSGNFTKFDRILSTIKNFPGLIIISCYFYSKIVDIVSQTTFTAIINTSLNLELYHFWNLTKKIIFAVKTRKFSG